MFAKNISQKEGGFCEAKDGGIVIVLSQKNNPSVSVAVSSPYTGEPYITARLWVAMLRLTAKEVLADAEDDGTGANPFIGGLVGVIVVDCAARGVPSV